MACAAILTSACDKMPLLAPRESTITVSSNSSVVQANGTAEIRATVLEPAGTPVQNGTTVTFTTNLGALSPTEARTINGVATVRFDASGQSGTAEIRAISGGAASEPVSLTVGGAAADSVSVNANPTIVAAGGGSSSITARVLDASGNPLQGVTVTFSTTAGSLSTTTATTDLSGNALTTLTTNRDATVTANVAGKSATAAVGIALRPIVSVVTSSGEPSVGGPTTFAITVNPATGGPPLEKTIINYGDRSVDDLGAVTGSTSAQHTYDDHGTFTVTVTARDISGTTGSASTVIVVQPVVIVSLAASVDPTTKFATFTATVRPSDVVVATYVWSFGDGQSETTATNQVGHPYALPGIYNVTVTVVTATGRRASASTTVIIPGP